MGTSFTILRVDRPAERAHAALEPQPGYFALKAIIEPLLDDEPLEHVSVLHDGRRCDMFVSELGKCLTTRPPLPRNEAATAIYRENWLVWHPGDDPEDLPAIHGTAVLFDRLVWF